MKVRSSRTVRSLAILLFLGICASSTPLAAQTKLTVGEFHGNDSFHPLTKMRLVFYPRDEFTSCDISVKVCNVTSGDGGLTHLTDCLSESVSLTTMDFLPIAFETLPILTKTIDLPMSDAVVDFLFVGVEFDTEDRCVPAFYQVPRGQGSWYVPEDRTDAQPHLSLARIEEVLMGNPVTSNVNPPCASSHIKLQGGPVIP